MISIAVLQNMKNVDAYFTLCNHFPAQFVKNSFQSKISCVVFSGLATTAL